MKFLSRLLAIAVLAVGICLTTSSSQAAAQRGMGNRNFNNNGNFNRNRGFFPGFFPGYFPGFFPGLGYPGYGGFPGGGGNGGYPSGGYGNSGYGYSSYGGRSEPLFVFTPTYTSRNTKPVAAAEQEDGVKQASYTPPETSIATVEVRVPADAKVWFAGTPTDQTGDDRVFESPPLIEGKTYTYEVKAQWMKDGKPVEKTQSVSVQAGQRSVTTFTAN